MEKTELKNKIEAILLEYDQGGYYDPYVKKLLQLFKEQEEETVKQVRYGNLGRCPRHYEALRCLGCVHELNEAKSAE